MEDTAEQRCRDFVARLLHARLKEEAPDLVALSIALGVCEASLTDKAQQRWPERLEADVEAGVETFQAFVDRAAAKLGELGGADARAKVKAVADLIWSHLTGSFSKDVQHVQHIAAFTRALTAPKGPGKRQLDCAGVVTATLAACHRLAAQHAAHAELAACRLQVSEDHCWISLGPEGAREGSVEVTTDTAAKRGQAVSPEAWAGWLYTGGSAVLCTPQMALAALVTSVNPSIVARQNTGTDSAPLQALQAQLLQQVRAEQPGALYPAALCCLADLCEIRRQDELQAAVLAGERAAVCSLLERSDGDAQALFEQALAASLTPRLGNGRCWYPHSYLIGFLTRRTRFVLADARPLLGEGEAWERGGPLLREALRLCGSEQAAAVLRGYRFTRADEQLHKDVEGTVEAACDICRHLGGEGRLKPTDLMPLLELWDGVCHCWGGQPKPAAWLAALLRTARLFPGEARAQAAAAAQVSSPAMVTARELWGPLKLPQLRPIFEAADVQPDAPRAPKRPRR